MLTAELRRDAAPLPGLPMLLDDSRLRDWLAGHGLTAPFRRRYLRYKPGTSAVLGLDLGGAPTFLLAVDPAGEPKLAKYRRAAPGAILAIDPGRRLLLARPAADRDLPAAAGLDPGLRTLAYKPMRRWVGERSGTVLRAYRPGASTDTACRYRLVHAAGAPTAAVVAHDRSRALLTVAHLPGRPVRPEDLPAVGRALAALHGLPVPARLPASGGPGWAASTEQARRLRPGLGPALARLRAAAGSAPPFRPSLVHGDFSLDQVVVDGERVRLLDLDRAGVGDPAVDVAGVAAELGELAEPFLAGYREVAPLPALEVAVLRASLARLAEPFRTCRPHWSSEIDDRVKGLVERIAA